MKRNGLTMEERFFDLAMKRPGACALAFAGSQGWTEWSYQDLAKRAMGIATSLIRMGLKLDQPVGVTCYRHPDTIAAILGILKAGGVYLPLDNQYPTERLHQLCQAASVDLCLSALPPANRLPVATHWIEDILEKGEKLDPHSSQDPFLSRVRNSESPAYILFTSGSTGEPKGVVVPHRAVIRLVDQPNFLNLDTTRSFLWMAPLGFDASVLEIWAPLLNGGKCVLFPEEEAPTSHRLGEVIRAQGVDCLWLTASLFNSIVDQDPTCLGPVADLLVGGEALSVPHVRKALAALPNTQITNGYGPTENTTFTTCYQIPYELPDFLSRIPIGSPIKGTSVVVVDETMTPVGPNEEGELLALGEGLALGYLYQPELTREKFITVELPHLGSVKAYRTGDRVVQRPDGLLDFLGRLDDQLKIEGHRIEPGEIESEILRLKGVRSARILAKTAPTGQKRLVAYLVCDHEVRDINLLRSQLSQYLPAFLIPHYFLFLDQFPLTTNGKMDLASLPDPFASRVLVGNPHYEQGFEKVVSAWKVILGVVPPSLDINFFDAGATSLDAIRLLELLESIAGKPLEPFFVFSYPTPRRQAQALQVDNGSSATPENRGELRRAALANKKRGAS